MSIYQKTAQVFDKSNRSALSGTRVESLTYIFEQAGSYELKEQVIYWWNSQTSELEQLVIPALTWAVSGRKSNKTNDSMMNFKSIKFNYVTILTLVFTLFLLVLNYLIFVKRQQLIIAYKNITKYEQRRVHNLFLANIA
ncbi:MAG: protein BatD [Alteromonadales bacterium]|nr:protein BatD [Alteromonadales bacterium]